jgi:VIT family
MQGCPHREYCRGRSGPAGSQAQLAPGRGTGGQRRTSVDRGAGLWRRRATNSTKALLTAGLAGLLAGSLSPAAGEYVWVSSHRDSERAALDEERHQLTDDPADELAELARLYQDKGLPPDLAREVAVHLTGHDALGAHAEAELGIDPDEMANPWHAARASLVSFAAGALLPLLAIVLPASVRLYVTVVCVLGPAGVRAGQRPPGTPGAIASPEYGRTATVHQRA